MNSSSRASSSFRRHVFAGILHQTNKAGETVTRRKIFADQDIVIGRDSSRCQYIIDDPCVSNKHLRVYTIIYDDENLTEVGPLVYAEDLSRNGTYWNRSLIGKGNGGFLLSDGDTLRLSSSTLLRFERVVGDKDHFDVTQENEMKYFRKKYVITDRLLGAGAYGKVYMAINESQRRQLACKVVDFRKMRPQIGSKIGRPEYAAQAEDVDNRVQLRKLAALAEEKKKEHLLENKLAQWYREVDILASINHPNIVGVEKVYVTDNTLYIFQDLVTAGDLFSYLEKKNGRLMEVEVAVIVRQIVIAVKFLHSQNIVHRDIKPDNILMTTLATGCRVVLTDFGMARKLANPRQRMSTSIGTAEYVAPEVRSDRPGLRQGYSKAVDMWSLGCVTVVLLTGGSAFRDPYTNEHSDTLAMNCNLAELERSSEWSEVSTRPKAFVGNLLLLDESQRLTAEEALQDSWFSNEFHKTDFEDLYNKTIRYWQPKTQKKSIIEFSNSREVRQLPCSQEVLASERRTRGRVGQTPVEPPYKPFPMQMHQALFPPRRPPGSQFNMSDVVKAAIREHWMSSSSSGDSSEPDISALGKTTQYLQPRKPFFKALRKPPSPGQLFSQAAQQTNLNGGAGASLESDKDHRASNHKETKTATPSTPRAELDRPSTPRPKSRSSGHTLPLRAVSNTPHVSSNHHYKPDHDVRKVAADHVAIASSGKLTKLLSHEVEETLKDSMSDAERRTPYSQSLFQNSAIKPNSGLKLSMPRSTNLPSISTSSSKKRRRASIYDFEDDEEETEEAANEFKHQRPMWQTAAKAFDNPRKDGKGVGLQSETESVLVPRTPSPIRENKSVYLPRL